MASALSAVSSFKNETLRYRTTHAGSLTALTGWVLHRDRVPQPSFIGDRQAEAEVKEGFLKGPLTPAMSVGYEVVDGNSEAWVVESVMADSQQICRVKRSRTIALAPDRGQTR
jgi:hypothetical protein